MGFFDVLGNVGGIQQVFIAVFAILLSYYSEICFYINAIDDMYTIRTKDSSLVFVKDRLQVSFCNKLKLITSFCPNKKMKRLLAKGYERLDTELDLFEIIKEHKHVHRHYKKQNTQVA